MNHPHDADYFVAITRSFIEEYRQQQDAVISVLYEVQDAVGYVPPEVESLIASELGSTVDAVHQTVTEHPFLRSTPAGKHLVRVCRGDNCTAANRQLLQHIEAALNCPEGTTREDGEVTLEKAACMGICKSAPVVEIDDHPYRDMNEARFAKLMGSMEVSVAGD